MSAWRHGPAPRNPIPATPQRREESAWPASMGAGPRSRGCRRAEREAFAVAYLDSGSSRAASMNVVESTDRRRSDSAPARREVTLTRHAAKLWWCRHSEAGFRVAVTMLASEAGQQAWSFFSAWPDSLC